LKLYQLKIMFLYGAMSALTACSGLSPTPYSDAISSPLKVYNERVIITPKNGFKPEKLSKIVVSVSRGNIKQGEQGDLKSRLEGTTTSALLEKGYDVVSRSVEDARKAELEYQANQKTKGAASAEYAAVTSALLVVDVTKKIILDVKGEENQKHYQNHVSVSVKLLNLQSSVVLWIAEASKSEWIKKGLENDLVEHTLKDIMSEFPQKKITAK